MADRMVSEMVDFFVGDGAIRETSSSN